jgi:hypothetical protein
MAEEEQTGELDNDNWHWTYTLLVAGATLGVFGVAWSTYYTVINHIQIIGVVIAIALLSYFPFRYYFKKKNYDIQNILIMFCLFGFAPLAASIIFSLNVVIPVGEPYNEKYAIDSIITVPEKEGEIKSTVVLKNNAYTAYRSVRTFYGKNFTGNERYLTFTFQDGILGLKQLKDASFTEK